MQYSGVARTTIREPKGNADFVCFLFQATQAMTPQHQQVSGPADQWSCVRANHVISRPWGGDVVGRGVSTERKNCRCIKKGGLERPLREESGAARWSEEEWEIAWVGGRSSPVSTPPPHCFFLSD